MNIHESAEDYLETIYVLIKRNGNVRSIDIATEMGFSKPSISRAMKLLRTDEYISIDHTGNITLLDKGLEIATRIYLRHEKLKEFFLRLGVNQETAEKDACRAEHYLSDETYEKLMSFAASK